MSVLDNYTTIRGEIDGIARSAGRNPDEVRIIAVSKTFPEPLIQGAIDQGIRIFGENKVQEAKRKIPNLHGDFFFHMIGHLQSNKARDAVALFDVIHSIDKISTAARVNEEAERLGKRQRVLIQANISGEDTKSGVSPDESIELAEAMLRLPHIELVGIMTMAPFTDDASVIRATFRGARELLDRINASLDRQLRELSMGMSSDYAIAVEEGATMVRIGTAIFGERSYP
ncbi:MAG: YggS family pyridoxal phosphate-dependent enzyme [Spirochaetes bacterium]|nr:YggS family pyridoxal phosphate-dependent enzyme [Spirochaetota bacterium]